MILSLINTATLQQSVKDIADFYDQKKILLFLGRNTSYLAAIDSFPIKDKEINVVNTFRTKDLQY